VDCVVSVSAEVVGGLYEIYLVSCCDARKEESEFCIQCILELQFQSGGVAHPSAFREWGPRRCPASPARSERTKPRSPGFASFGWGLR
jgi:hypothetical protein